MSSSESLVSKRVVIARVRVVGFHQWDKAPFEVAYLSHKHRHVFTILGEWRVDHNDRDVEYHTAQRWIGNALDRSGWAKGYVYEFGERSCEQIAIDLHSLIIANDKPAPDAIEVWEDDENGSRIEFKGFKP